MKGAKLQLSVGLLVLVGAALLVAFVLFLTGDRLRAATVFETYVRESVQGLEVGASVRYRGVAVGRVTEINLVQNVYPPAGDRRFSPLYQQVIVRFALDTAVTERGITLEEAVRAGLRARLASQGITGIVYLELDFLDADRYAATALPWTPENGVIPSVPSTVAQVQSAAESLLRRLEEVDFAGLVQGLSAVFASFREQTGDGGDLAGLLAEARGTAAAVRRIAEGTNAQPAIEELRGAAAALRALAESRELRQAVAASGQAAAEFRQAATRLPQVIQSLEATLRGAESTLRSARGATTDVQAELAPILRDLRATAANLRDTTELVRRSPGAAIFGAPPPPPAEARR